MELKTLVKQSIDLMQSAENLALQFSDEGFFVGFSGGKDSQVLLDLVKRADVKYKAYYSVTTLDPPENVKFIEKYYPDVHFLYPTKNFFKLVEEKGLPTRLRRYCCVYLKEGHGINRVVLTGVRAEESVKRSQYNEVSIISNRNEHKERKVKTIKEIEQAKHKCIKGKDKIMLYPILRWTEADIYNYLDLNHITINPLYNYVGRVGCMFCPFSSVKEMRLWELRYASYVDKIKRSCKKYLENKKYFENENEMWEWYKSKLSINEYKECKKQLKIEL